MLPTHSASIEVLPAVSAHLVTAQQAALQQTQALPIGQFLHAAFDECAVYFHDKGPFTFCLHEELQGGRWTELRT